MFAKNREKLDPDNTVNEREAIVLEFVPFRSPRHLSGYSTYWLRRLSNIKRCLDR